MKLQEISKKMLPFLANKIVQNFEFNSCLDKAEIYDYIEESCSDIVYFDEVLAGGYDKFVTFYFTNLDEAALFLLRYSDQIENRRKEKLAVKKVREKEVMTAKKYETFMEVMC